MSMAGKCVNVSAQHLSQSLLNQAGVLLLCWSTSSWAHSESVAALCVLICSWFILEQSVSALRQEIKGSQGEMRRWKNQLLWLLIIAGFKQFKPAAQQF